MCQGVYQVFKVICRASRINIDNWLIIDSIGTLLKGYRLRNTWVVFQFPSVWFYCYQFPEQFNQSLVGFAGVRILEYLIRMDKRFGDECLLRETGSRNSQRQSEQ